MRLQLKESAVGTLALEAHGRTSNEAVQEGMVASSFKLREVNSTITFDQRLTVMMDKRWTKNVYKHVYMKSINAR